MPVSDEQLQTKRDKVEKLREQLAAAENTRETKVRETENEVEAQLLDQEASDLEARLKVAREAAKVGVIRESAGTALTDDQDNASSPAENKE